jgi:2-polyprenyl-3-methyl-5-hydroxy-6-metoxy-1,4-benzoquinol methylase
MPEEIITKCPVCGTEEKEVFLHLTDHFVSKEAFTISRCNNCQFCFTDPRPSLEESHKYYESEEYVSHSKTDKGITNYLFHRARQFTIKSKRRIAAKYSSGKTILDYGCGTGEFLAAMANSGWDARGIEPNTVAREHAREKYEIEVYDESAIESIPDNSLDAITLWHVLEHIYPLQNRLHSFHKMLKQNGTLIVAVPNTNSFDAKRYGAFWAAYDVPRHLYHFAPDNIKRLLAESGFTFVRSHGMMLDAFYISLLSEKYKHGSDKFLKGMFFGFLSNLSAFLGNRNYSSLIYIFKKSI